MRQMWVKSAKCPWLVCMHVVNCNQCKCLICKIFCMSKLYNFGRKRLYLSIIIVASQARRISLLESQKVLTLKIPWYFLGSNTIFEIELCWARKNSPFYALYAFFRWYFHLKYEILLDRNYFLNHQLKKKYADVFFFSHRSQSIQQAL